WAANRDIIDPDNLSLVGTGQEHETIVGLRLGACGVGFCRVVVSPRYADQQRRQYQPKDSTTPTTGSVSTAARAHLPSSPWVKAILSDRDRFQFRDSL